MALVGPLIALVMLALLAAMLHRSLRKAVQAPPGRPSPRPTKLTDPIGDDYGLLATAAVARTHADAVLIKEHLRSAGIRSTLANAPDGQVRVLVFGDEVVRARRLVS